MERSHLHYPRGSKITKGSSENFCTLILKNKNTVGLNIYLPVFAPFPRSLTNMTDTMKHFLVMWRQDLGINVTILHPLRSREVK